MSCNQIIAALEVQAESTFESMVSHCESVSGIEFDAATEEANEASYKELAKEHDAIRCAINTLREIA